MYETFGNASSIRWWPNVDGSEYRSDGPPVDDDGCSYRHQWLLPAVFLCFTRNSARRAQFQHFARMYGGLEQATASPVGMDPSAQIFEPATLPYNLIRSTTNTLVAKVAKDRPVPMYLPVGGDHRIQKRTRLLNRFVTGLFLKHRVHYHGYLATRDAALHGSGLLLIQPDGKKVSVEQLFPWEVNVDPIDARYGTPRSLHLVRYIDKDVLKHRFPKFADRIESAMVLDELFMPVQDVFASSTRCTVVESWHLRSGEGALDGRHVICLLNDTLVDERWDVDDFPIAKLTKDAPLAGWWGLGLGDEISGYQEEKNMMAARVQYAHKIVGGQVWMVPDGGGILDTDFNDEIGVVVRTQGGREQFPECVNPTPLHPQTYQYFNDIDTHAYGFSGISTMSAQGQRPAGVTAALAIQTLDDMETDRFSMFERAHEEFYLDVARHMLRCVREIAEKYSDFQVFSANKGRGQEVLWKRDVDLDEDSYVVQSWPTSLLPKSPSAKLQRVLELSAQNIFDKSQVLKLLELPDTTTEERLMLAPREAAEAQIALILECDDPRDPANYMPPSKFQDVAYAMSRAQQEYNLLQADAIDHGTIHQSVITQRLVNLSRYAQACNDFITEMKKEAQAQAAATALPPGADAPPPAGPPPTPSPAGPPAAGPPIPAPDDGQQ